MSIRMRKTGSIIRKAVPSFLLLIVVLLGAGCTAPFPQPREPCSGTSVPSGNPIVPAVENCTFTHLIGTTEVQLSDSESCYFSTHTPMEFLNDLRTHPHQPVMVMGVPDGWITLHDAELLMQEIDSEDPAAAVVSPISSYWPFNQTSTVGNEALYLIEGYRSGKYPPALCSVYYFKPDRSEVRLWWDTSGKQGMISEGEAIRILTNTYPDLCAYPSDGLPPRSVRTEQAPEGWYVAFIQEGSGLPILSARCYYVDNDRTTRLTGMVNQSIMVLPQDFSPRWCG